MISALKGLDRNAAVGVLARAALALAGAGNPAAKEIVEHEAQLRREVLEIARQALGISQADNTPQEIERLADFLDAQSEELAGHPDIKSAYTRLMESGNLPSDLYDVRFIDAIKSNLGSAFEREEPLIRQTIASPSREQHFGNHKLPGQPCLISLFARRFITPYPYKNFIMLIAAQRGAENLLSVAQAWRIYPSLVDLTGARDLVDYLKRFADHYGYEVSVGDQKGKFFLDAQTVAPPAINIDLKGQKKTVNVTQFQQFDPTIGRQTAALVVAVDLGHYLRDLKTMDAEILP